MSITIEAIGNALLHTKNNSIGVQAVEVIGTMQSLGWLSPDELAIRDTETTRRALRLAAKLAVSKAVEYEAPEEQIWNCSEPIAVRLRGLSDAILALQLAPTGWKLVPEEPTTKQLSKAFIQRDEEHNADLVAAIKPMRDAYHANVYRAMIGSVK